MQHAQLQQTSSNTSTNWKWDNINKEYLLNLPQQLQLQSHNFQWKTSRCFTYPQWASASKFHTYLSNCDKNFMNRAIHIKVQLLMEQTLPFYLSKITNKISKFKCIRLEHTMGTILNKQSLLFCILHDIIGTNIQLLFTRNSG